MLLRISCLAVIGLIAGCGSATVRTTEEPEAIAPAPSPDPDPTPAVEAPVVEAPVPASTVDTTAPAGSEVEIRRIGRWVTSGVTGARRLVIRDPNTWTRFWNELGAGVQPQVDFSRDLVIAVASGERTSGGHDIVVQRVTRAGSELRIEVLETSPGPNCLTTAAMTQPVDVVQVPSAGVEGWSFIDRKAASAC
jgi:PrcB C-terminal